ncbi:hypothetical protein, partial [Paenisporosarcina sp. TG20]|uniref:hypothetical protein n=1 Tax=Paenisporosarcina sp. TG20 TaxID=1211706 RepID=UPI001ED8CFE0
EKRDRRDPTGSASGRGGLALARGKRPPATEIISRYCDSLKGPGALTRFFLLCMQELESIYRIIKLMNVQVMRV